VPFNYERLSPENQNLWLIRSSNIDLKNFVIQPKFEQAALNLTYSMHMTALDGVQPDIAENVRETGIDWKQTEPEEAKGDTVIKVCPTEPTPEELAAQQ
jgi:hypothetical protein